MTSTISGIDRNYFRGLRDTFQDPKVYLLDAGGSREGLDTLDRAGVDYLHASTDTQVLQTIQEIMSEVSRRLAAGHDPNDRFLVVIANNMDVQDDESAHMLKRATAWISNQDHGAVRLCWHRTASVSPVAKKTKKADKISKKKAPNNKRSRATTR